MALTSSQQTWNPPFTRATSRGFFRIIFAGMKINPKPELKSTIFDICSEYDRFWACDQAIKVVPY